MLQIVSGHFSAVFERRAADQTPVLSVEHVPAVHHGGTQRVFEAGEAVPIHHHPLNQLCADRTSQAILFVLQVGKHVLHPLCWDVTYFLVITQLLNDVIDKRLQICKFFCGAGPVHPVADMKVVRQLFVPHWFVGVQPCFDR